jgi:ferric-dicitrate binding protein FerR (iron transport regulator)
MLAHNRVWYLMARNLSNEASEAEREELQSILQQDAALQQQYAMLQEFWTPAQLKSTHSAGKLEKLLRKAKQRESETNLGEVIEMKSSGQKRFWWIAAASVLVIAISVFLYTTSLNSSQSIASNTSYNDSITTQNGNRSQLILPDGSRVWLNSGSRLLYQKNFNGKYREVQLIGEAYFDVVKMPEKPFIVHAEGINIKVLGTAFNVKCYPKDEKIEATLLRGAISVTHRNDPDQKVIFLKPNEKLSINKQFIVSDKSVAAYNPYKIINLDTTVAPSHLQETAWVYNRLEFRDLDFRTLAEKMERWYNVNIIFLDKEVQYLHFIGSFENETIEEALQALQAVARFKYEIKNHEIHISSSN